MSHLKYGATTFKSTINLLSYAVVGILLALLLIVVFVLSCKFIFRIDMTPLSHVDLGIKEQDVQINREQG